MFNVRQNRQVTTWEMKEKSVFKSILHFVEKHPERVILQITSNQLAPDFYCIRKMRTDVNMHVCEVLHNPEEFPPCSGFVKPESTSHELANGLPEASVCEVKYRLHNFCITYV